MGQINHPGLQCFNCGHDLSELPAPIGRHDNCPQCFEAVHNCRTCRHYAPNSPGACAEDQAEPPSNKETANFCDWFQPATGGGGGNAASKNDAARARLDELFSKD